MTDFGGRHYLDSIGSINVDGVAYDVCTREGKHGTVQLAWISKAGIVVATIHGLVRGEPRVSDKESALAWPDELDDEAVAGAVRVWDEAGLLRGTVKLP
jgi:hypothetical protein